METSESYKMLLPDDLKSFRTFSELNFCLHQCPEFQNHFSFEAIFHAFFQYLLKELFLKDLGKSC